MKHYAILLGISIGTVLLLLSTLYYPGGTYLDAQAEGYNWANNYISNLLRPLAVNGEANSARPFAIFGVLFLTASFGWFFVRFSAKLKIKSASLVIKYLGILATLFGFITVVPPMHDLMVTLSSILTLLIFFYITVMVLKSKLTWLKVMSVLFLATFYFGAYMYFSRFQLAYMPIVQKIIFLMKIIWVISLEYGTRKEDFAHILK